MKKFPGIDSFKEINLPILKLQMNSDLYSFCLRIYLPSVILVPQLFIFPNHTFYPFRKSMCISLILKLTRVCGLLGVKISRAPHRDSSRIHLSWRVLQLRHKGNVLGQSWRWRHLTSSRQQGQTKAIYAYVRIRTHK